MKNVTFLWRFFIYKAVFADGNPLKEMTISVGFPKDIKVDDTMIQ